MKDDDVYISTGKRAWWQLLLAALFFTTALYFVYLFLSSYAADIDKNHRRLGSLLQMAVLSIAAGFAFSRVVIYKFDLKNKNYRITNNFGIFRYGKTYQFESVDYIAVYGNQLDQFEINLWYNKNKHFTLAHYLEESDALAAGKTIAMQLSIDVWNATDRHNAFWEDESTN